MIEIMKYRITFSKTTEKVNLKYHNLKNRERSLNEKLKQRFLCKSDLKERVKN